jgi:hypothetical protein
VGRIGSAHLEAARQADGYADLEDLVRAYAYLGIAWNYHATSLVRSWVPLDFHRALVLNDRDVEARALAKDALDRLSIQLGRSHEVVEYFRSALAPPVPKEVLAKK